MYQARRDLGVKYKDLTPEALREYIYEVNRARYDGDPFGGSFGFFENKYKSNLEIEGKSQIVNYCDSIKIFNSGLL